MRSLVTKALLGCLVAIVVAILGCGLLELGLRMVGYGHAPGFWRREKDAQGRRSIRENWWVTIPFFSPELMRRPQPFRLEEKTADSYRIFVLGSSAAMGDPEPSFSLARILETMLRAAYPKTKFEVINAGITAINSHVVRGIAEDCAKLQPDLFIVYEGNNEVIGPFGPGTIFTPVLKSPAAVRAAITLRGLRLGQALTALARKTKNVSGTPADWGGMQMFLQHEIRADDQRLDQTEHFFASNLRAIAEAGVRSGARVILGTVLTNQKDFSPFQSRHHQGFSEEQARAWDAVFNAGSEASTTGDWSTAERHFREALTIDDDFAEGHFRLARVLLRAQKTEEARREFQRALDLDVLRFRTDSRLNETIRRVAATAGEGVILADLVKAGEADSPGGILGDELLYEHVHLSFRGTYVVARNLFQHVAEDLRRRGRLDATPLAEPLPIDEVRRRLAFTTYEQAMIVKELLARVQRSPFTGQSSNPQRIAGLKQRDSRAAQLLTLPESAESIFAIYDQAIAANPSDWVLHRNYGMALAALHQGARAKTHLQNVLEVIPDDPDTLYGLILAHRELRETAEAWNRTEELRKLAPRYPGLETLK